MFMVKIFKFDKLKCEFVIFFGRSVKWYKNED